MKLTKEKAVGIIGAMWITLGIGFAISGGITEVDNFFDPFRSVVWITTGVLGLIATRYCKLCDIVLIVSGFLIWERVGVNIYSTFSGEFPEGLFTALVWGWGYLVPLYAKALTTEENCYAGAK